MKKLYLLLLLPLLLLLVRPTYASPTEVLTSPWNFTANSGAVDKYQSLPANSLNGKASITLTYDLNGKCILGGDASAIIFDQNGWKYISLSSYGQNCYDGQQVVTIPLSAFGVNTNANLTGSFHARFWHSSAYNIDITSAILNDAVTPTPTNTPTPTPSPSPTPHWEIESIDAMKVTKDVVCNPYNATQRDAWLDKAVDLGATHVAISNPYENPTCGNAITQTQDWVADIRDHGLKVWHRHMPLAHEGIYNTPKHRSPDGARYLKIIADWIRNNRSLIQDGDIFTPIPEPQNGGINGINGCGSLCQYAHTADFNEWIRMAQLVSETAINDPDVKVGYYGFDGFLLWGDNNPDHQGTSKIEALTVARMGNVIAIDHYPATNASMAGDLDEARALWPNADFVIGEWGTIFQSTDTAKEQAVIDTFNALTSRSYIKGVNYWHGCCGGNESLWNSNGNNNAHYDELKSYFKP